MSTKIQLKDVRIAFCQSLFSPEQYQGAGPFRYSSVFLIEPGSANDKAIRAAVKAEADKTWTKPGQGDIKVRGFEGNSNKFCYVSGDTKEYDGFQGKMALSAHRKDTDGAPTIVDRDKSPLTARSGKPYGGCYVNAVVEIWAQNNENAGIRCTLGGVQFLRDGDAFGGAAKVSDDEFDDLGVDQDEDSLV